MEERQQQYGNWVRTAIAALIGVTGAVALWVVTPYNNFYLNNTSISDGYLPLGVLAVMLLLGLGVNPLLRVINPRLALRRGQLALAVGIMLVATVVPGQGLMKLLPYSLVDVPSKAAGDKVLADELQKMHLPPGTWPDPIEYGSEAPVSERFIGELLPGEPVPWSAWMGPAMIWGSVVLFSWLLMMGLAAILLPQWRDNERLAFPLLRIQEALIEDPDRGRFLAPLFRSRAFWVAALVILALRILAGLNTYFPEQIPDIPLSWNLQGLFTEEPWAYLNKQFYTGQVFFLLVGIAFFMPNRISFSLWFLVVFYFFYEVVGKAYFPPYDGGTVREQRMGALFALAVGVLWLGRSRWAHVFRTMFRRAREPGESQDRIGGYMFVVGALGVFAWLVYMGVQPGFAALFTLFAFLVTLVISRVVAEAGLPYIAIRTELMRVARLFPAKWGTTTILGSTSLFFSVVIGILFTVTSRTCAAASGMHALALNEDAGRHQRGGMALLMVGVLLAGFFVAGAAHLNLNYAHASTLDGQTQPLNSGYYIWIGDAIWGVKDLRSGSTQVVTYSRELHIGIGFSVAALLFILCLAMPRWPLHPIGLLVVASWMGQAMWPSIFLGWLIKQVIVRYGGARLYRAARPFFLGLIIGEVFAALFWAVIPLIMYAVGGQYQRPGAGILF